MEFKLAKKGTVTECREALNAALAEMPLPETQENKVKRMIAHYVVAEHLDPIHDGWQRKAQAAAFMRTPKAQGGGGGEEKDHPEPAEPLAAFAIDCTIALS